MVCAVGAVPLGVDIQVERPVRPAVFRALSAAEQAELDGLAERERLPAFFDVWCLKEAYTKAIGLGLQARFRDFFGEQKSRNFCACFFGVTAPFGTAAIIWGFARRRRLCRDCGCSWSKRQRCFVRTLLFERHGPRDASGDTATTG